MASWRRRRPLTGGRRRPARRGRLTISRKMVIFLIHLALAFPFAPLDFFPFNFNQLLMSFSRNVKKYEMDEPLRTFSVDPLVHLSASVIKFVCYNDL